MKQLAFLMKSLGVRGAIIHSRTLMLMAHSSAGAFNFKRQSRGEFTRRTVKLYTKWRQ